MTDKHNSEWQGEEGEPEDGDDDGDDENARRRDPLDMNEHEWLGESYGKLNNPRRLVAEGLVQINFHEDLAAIETLSAKILKLANAQFDFVIGLGDPELGDKQIRSGVSLTGCFKGLLKTRDELLDGIGRRR